MSQVNFLIFSFSETEQGQNKPLIQNSIQNQLFDFIKVEEDGVIHSSELFKTPFEEDFKVIYLITELFSN